LFQIWYFVTVLKPGADGTLITTFFKEIQFFNYVAHDLPPNQALSIDISPKTKV
jgi:hypothetical protein